MSIEKNIESIAKSLAIIAENLQSNVTSTIAKSEWVYPASSSDTAPVQPVAPAFAAPDPVNQVPAFAPPAFTTPEPAPTVELPFADTAGFTQYLIASFQKLEAKAPGTGGNIQRVIESIGCKNVNEVQPGSWAAVYAEVEKLVA